MTCDGCYHALIMAGGESQLSAVIADWGLSNFSEAAVIARLIRIRVMAYIRCGSRKEFVICGDYSVVKEHPSQTDLNYYRHVKGRECPLTV